MLPNFLVEETIVRESGQSAVFDAAGYANKNLMVILGITHAVEEERIGVEIYGSNDGATWTGKPLLSFTPRSYCGTYEMKLLSCGSRYLKAVWSVQRWSRREGRPFFSFYVLARPADTRALAAGAA